MLPKINQTWLHLLMKYQIYIKKTAKCKLRLGIWYLRKNDMQMTNGETKYCYESLNFDLISVCYFKCLQL